jgi:hypothetical protein
MATTRRELAVWNVVVVERNTTIQKKNRSANQKEPHHFPKFTMWRDT